MRKLHTLVVVNIVACTAVFILTLGDLLALHDIAKDYVSPGILRDLDVSLSQDLPPWTETPGEWRLVTVSYLARIAFLILSWITLVLCAGALRARGEEPA